jgi:hypothetical protein
MTGKTSRCGSIRRRAGSGEREILRITKFPAYFNSFSCASTSRTTQGSERIPEEGIKYSPRYCVIAASPINPRPTTRIGVKQQIAVIIAPHIPVLIYLFVSMTATRRTQRFLTTARLGLIRMRSPVLVGLLVSSSEQVYAWRVSPGTPCVNIAKPPPRITPKMR